MFEKNAMRSGGLMSKKSFDQTSQQSGKRSDKASVNFAIGGKQQADTMRSSDKIGAASGGDQKSYGIPTLKMLNPELYKEIEK